LPGGAGASPNSRNPSRPSGQAPGPSVSMWFGLSPNRRTLHFSSRSDFSDSRPPQRLGRSRPPNLSPPNESPEDWGSRHLVNPRVLLGEDSVVSAPSWPGLSRPSTSSSFSIPGSRLAPPARGFNI